MRFVAYMRVSTRKQGDFGHGLDAQRNTVEEYIKHKGGRIVEEFVEVESGKNNDRPLLQRALNHCILTGATLIVAKLDRLSRDAAFITNLHKTGVNFTICDFPEANNFTINIFAALAQYERELICSRTKAGLAAAKAKGVVLGKTAEKNRNKHEEKFSEGRKLGGAVRKTQANAFVDRLRPIIEACQKESMNYTQIAERLNEAEIMTFRKKLGGWKPQSVKNVIKRLEAQV